MHKASIIEQATTAIKESKSVIQKAGAAIKESKSVIQKAGAAIKESKSVIQKVETTVNNTKASIKEVESNIEKAATTAEQIATRASKEVARSIASRDLDDMALTIQSIKNDLAHITAWRNTNRMHDLLILAERWYSSYDLAISCLYKRMRTLRLVLNGKDSPLFKKSLSIINTTQEQILEIKTYVYYLFNEWIANVTYPIEEVRLQLRKYARTHIEKVNKELKAKAREASYRLGAIEDELDKIPKIISTVTTGVIDVSKAITDITDI